MFYYYFRVSGKYCSKFFFFLKTRSNVANVIYYSTSNEYNDISIIRAERNDVTYSFSNVIRRYFKKSIFRNTAGNPYIVNRCIGRIKNAHTRRIRNSRPQVQREPRRIRQPKRLLLLMVQCALNFRLENSNFDDKTGFSAFLKHDR